MRLELHCHSTRSDGSLPPEEVARRAHAYGVELFCLTDHDTTAGYALTRATLPANVIVLRGLELSAVEHGKTVHLLCYGVDEGSGAEVLHNRLTSVREVRTTRLRAIIERLGELGVQLDAEAIMASVRDKTPGRPHVAKALVDAGVVNSMQQAFERFLGDGKPAHVESRRLTVREGLELARAAGAKVSLAHPHTLGDVAVVRALYAEHRDAGLAGIEAFYGKYGPAAREPWLRVAAEYDLIPTGGSDFHGDTLPDVARPGITMAAADARRVVDWLQPSVSVSSPGVGG